MRTAGQQFLYRTAGPRSCLPLANAFRKDAFGKDAVNPISLLSFVLPVRKEKYNMCDRSSVAILREEMRVFVYRLVELLIYILVNVKQAVFLDAAERV